MLHSAMESNIYSCGFCWEEGQKLPIGTLEGLQSQTPKRPLARQNKQIYIGNVMLYRRFSTLKASSENVREVICHCLLGHI